MEVEVIGLGSMGGAIADRLTSCGFAPMVHDLDERRVSAKVLLGARRVGAAQPDVVITSLPADREVLAVLDDEWLEDHPGVIVLEMSTTLPDTVREVRARALRCAVAVLDVPVSGGPMEAASGDLVLIAGGDEGVIRQAGSVLSCLGEVVRVGDVGDAKLVKLINNVMAAGNLALASEAFALGARMGLQPRALFDLLNRSGGQSKTFGKRFPWALEGDFHARFPLRLAEKDVRLALAAASRVDVEVPIAQAIKGVFGTAVSRGWGDEDMVAVLKVYWNQGKDES